VSHDGFRSHGEVTFDSNDVSRGALERFVRCRLVAARSESSSSSLDARLRTRGLCDFYFLHAYSDGEISALGTHAGQAVAHGRAVGAFSWSKLLLIVMLGGIFHD
jgi:hypothetical protein